MTQHFFLVGYMGAGKSTIGKALALATQRIFYDLDDYIAEKEGQDVSAIFQQYGELYFRKKEQFYFKELRNNLQPKVVALGGGTPCYFDTMEQLLAMPNVKTIYLHASVTFLSHRLWPERMQRPLITHLDAEEKLTEFIGKHLFERNPYYQQAGH